MRRDGHAKKKLYELAKPLRSSLDLHECENLTRNLSLIRGYIVFLTRDSESVFSLSNTHLNNILQSLIIISKMEPRSIISSPDWNHRPAETVTKLSKKCLNVI